MIASTSSSNQNSNNGTSTLPVAQENKSNKGEGNIKQTKDNSSGKKKNGTDHRTSNESKINANQEPCVLENMETEVQSPIKSALSDKDKHKNDSQKPSQSSTGRMDPPKTSPSKKSALTLPKSTISSQSIVQAPATSSTVGGPSLPNRSTIGSSNQDFSSFRTYR